MRVPGRPAVTASEARQEQAAAERCSSPTGAPFQVRRFQQTRGALAQPQPRQQTRRQRPRTSPGACISARPAAARGAFA